jgi:hypothetical protein
MYTMRSLNKTLKAYGRPDLEITKWKGEFWLLHICQNGRPVPYAHCKKITEINDYIQILRCREAGEC